MKHFKLNHLEKNHLALVSEKGYDTADNQSTLAHKFLYWYEEKHDVTIQTAHSLGGEHRIGNYTVDGYIAETDTVIEVNGCHWHCHENCPNQRYTPDMVMPNGKTAGKIRENDARRLAFIKRRVREAKIFWECEIEAMRRRDRPMQRAFTEYHDRGPICLRDCFHGGRTGPFLLHYLVPPGWILKYFDVRSLYPYTTATTAYPVDHPARVNVIRVSMNC